MPDSGNIYIDDIEIKKYNVEYLRKHIGYLLQKPLLLRGNLVNAGTTQKSDSKNCRFIQAMYNDLIHAYLELTVENKKQLLG